MVNTMDNNQQNLNGKYSQNYQQSLSVNQQYGANYPQQNYGYSYPMQNQNYSNQNEFVFQNQNYVQQTQQMNTYYANSLLNSNNINMKYNQSPQNNGLKMKYYMFLTRFFLGVICAWFALRGFMIFTAHELGDSKSFVFEKFKNIKMTYSILGILYFVVTIAIVIAWIGLVKYKKIGYEVLLYCIFADAVLRIVGVAVLAKQISDIVGENIINTQDAYGAQGIWVLFDIIFIVLTNSYFKKRKDMFS